MQDPKVRVGRCRGDDFSIPVPRGTDTRPRHRDICDLFPESHRKHRGRAGTRNQVLNERLEVLKTSLQAVAIVPVNVNKSLVKIVIV